MSRTTVNRGRVSSGARPSSFFGSQPPGLPDDAVLLVTGDHGIRSTGKRYRNHYLHLLQIRDGKVVRWREFSNPNVFRDATT